MRFVRALALVVVCVLISPPQGAVAATCSLVPELRSITVNQGLGSYTPLVRGKETLLRAFLGKPKCAATADVIEVTGGQLVLSIGTTRIGTISAPTPVPVPIYPQVAPFSSAPVADWPGDPIFVIPGSVLAPTSTPVGFTVTFSLTINYNAKPGGTGTGTSGAQTFTTLTGSTAALTANVDKRTAAIRILVQPMGDPKQSLASQLSAAAQSALQDGMVTLSRIAPVPDGVGSLTGTTGGVRYTINTGILDVTSFLSTIGGLTKFCGNAANFDGASGVKVKLDQFLQAWNAANPSFPADRVLGIVDEAISFGASSGCAEGMAAVNGQQAWTRALSSMPLTGPLTTMEILHTGGVVPANRYDPYNPWHSPNTVADATSPYRAYNVAQRAYLATNKTVMDFQSTWTNSNTLAERDDYALWRCLLGGSTTSECATTSSGTVGTSTGVGANPTLTATGNVTATGEVRDANTYFTLGMPRTTVSPSSLQLVQINESVTPAATLRSDACPVTFATTDHDEHAAPATPPDPNNTIVGSFYCAYPYDTNASLIELVKDGAVVYTRRLRAQAPQVNSASVVGDANCVNFARFAVPTTGSEPFKITTGPDGNLWFTEFAANNIGKSAPDGTMTEYPISHWADTGSLSAPRMFHSASQLSNGKVLVAGGQTATTLVASASLYDPVTGIWTDVPAMTTARRFHTATVLADGMHVLVVGGQGSDSNDIATAELFTYDPDTGSGTWSAAGAMSVTRRAHAAALLGNGKVLVSGGFGPGGVARSSAELYDPVTNSWSTTGSMNGDREGHSATRLGSGAVLVAGGRGGIGFSELATAELYDPVTGIWGLTGSLTTARSVHTAEVLADGRVLVAGGGSVSSPTATAEIYTPPNGEFFGTWSVTGSLTTKRTEHASARLADGKVIVVGGTDGVSTAIASAEVFDPGTGSWSATSPMSAARRGLTATALANTEVLATGGFRSDEILSSAERFAEPPARPDGIVAGPDGNLWFVEVFANRIGRSTTAGSISQFTIPTPQSSSRNLAVGADGNLWFTEFGTNKIGKVTTAGTFTEYALAAGSGPRGIRSGPDGNIWFTEDTAYKIGKITPAGSVTEYAVPNPPSAPPGTQRLAGIATGGDGNLWFAETFANKIGKVTTSGSFTEYPIPSDGNSNTVGITRGPDGNVWFAEGIGSIGRITPGGVITTFSDPYLVTDPFSITAGPNGTLWFTQTDSLGRLEFCPGTQTASVSAGIGSNPDQGRLDVFSCTPTICYPIAVGLPPTTTSLDSATFNTTFDNTGCVGSTIRFVVNNGIQQSPPNDQTLSCGAVAPVATVDLPLAGQTFLSYDVIPLRGTATVGGSVIAGSALQFSSTSFPAANSLPAGDAFDLTPPSNGWTPGTYTIGLRATSGALNGTASTTITIKADSAHVGRPNDFTASLPPSCVQGRPWQPFADWDGDGIDNQSDADPCTPATFYRAVAVSVPGKLTSQDSSVTVGLVVPYRSVTQITPGSAVRVASVAGKPTAFTPNNLGWSVMTMPPTVLSSVQTSVPGLVDDKFGAVAFDAKKLAIYLQSVGLNNRNVTFEIVGQGSTGWTFQVFITMFVQLT